VLLTVASHLPSLFQLVPSELNDMSTAAHLLDSYSLILKTTRMRVTLFVRGLIKNDVDFHGSIQSAGYYNVPLSYWQPYFSVL
jgi:hypothetical protein